MKFLYKLTEEVELEHRLMYSPANGARMLDNEYIIGYLQVIPTGSLPTNELIKYNDDYFAVVVCNSDITGLYTLTRTLPHSIEDHQWTAYIRAEKLEIFAFLNTIVHLRVIE